MQGTPFHQRLPPQPSQTPQSVASTHTSYSTKPPSPLSSRPSTPLKMFTQTPPSANRLDETGRTLVSTTRTRRRKSGTSPVVTTKLPAIPAKGSYSYGSTTTVMQPTLRYADTSNPLKDLLQTSSDLAESRLRRQVRARSASAQQQDTGGAEQDDDDVDLGPPPPPNWGDSPAKELGLHYTRERDPVEQQRQLSRFSSAAAQRFLQATRQSGESNTNTNEEGRVTRSRTRGQTPAPLAYVPSRRGRPAAGRRIGATGRQAQPPSLPDSNRSFLRETSVLYGWEAFPVDSTFFEKIWHIVRWIASGFLRIYERISGLLASPWRFFVRIAHGYGPMIGRLFLVVCALIVLPIVVSLWVDNMGGWKAVTPPGVPSMPSMPTPPSISFPGLPSLPKFSLPRLPKMSLPSFGGSRISYSAPKKDPETERALIERLRVLEEMMQKFSEDRKEHLKDSKMTHEELSRDFKSYTKMMNQYTATVDQHTATIDAGYATATSDISMIQAKFRELQAMIEEEKKFLRSLDRESEKRFRNHDSVLENIKKELADDIKPRIDNLFKMHSRLSHAFERLEKNLPESIAVRVDSQGKMVILPEFYDAMRDFFRAEYPKGVTTVDGTAGERVIVEKPVKWDEWLRENEAKLKTYIGDVQQAWWTKATREQTVLSREQFIDLLKDEVARLDTKLKNISEEQSANMATSVRAFEKRMANLVSAISGPQKSWSGSSSPRTSPSSPLSGGAGLGGIIIDSTGTGRIGEFLAEGLYAQHASSLADYASHAGGAYIDPHTTSDTYSSHPKYLFYRALRWMVGHEIAIPRPKTVISGGLKEPGQCWPFSGAVGQVGVILRERIYVTGITVEHVEWERALAHDVAPKDIVLWVNVHPEDMYPDTVAAAASLFKLEGKDGRRVKEYQTQGEREKAKSGAKELPDLQALHYVKVGAWEFDWREGVRAEQTFSLGIDMRKLGVTSDRVVIGVESNWGNSNYTCLYRVRVHGEREEAVKRREEEIWRMAAEARNQEQDEVEGKRSEAVKPGGRIDSEWR
ncbi:hypothetical protein BDZ91DRAFT_730813 [Kalaharituber pfeilii]|nr:hypothetical protein BDZ91DRAFT_730813 [Kalaharituber pfeilii]